MKTEMLERIDTHIKRHFKVANSDEYETIAKTADSARKHGFTQSNNIKYAEFLRAFKDVPDMITAFEDAYPNSMFLPWNAFHAIRKSLDLWVDLPKNYLGAIPDECMPYLDMFEFQDDHSVKFDNIRDLLELSEGDQAGRNFMQLMAFANRAPGSFDDMAPFRRQSFNPNHLYVAKAREYFMSFRNELFVVAPPDAFAVKEDFITRFKRLIDEAPESKTPPNDPLVIRLVGCSCFYAHYIGALSLPCQHDLQ